MAATLKFLKVSAFVLFIAMSVISFTGCSRSTRTVHTDAAGRTVTTTTDPAATQGTVVTERTVVHDDPSVLGSAVNFIGEVIAFPFRLIGWIFSGIF
jgi:hypothetical protein